jgi:hypothetical protein
VRLFHRLAPTEACGGGVLQQLAEGESEIVRGFAILDFRFAIERKGDLRQSPPECSMCDWPFVNSMTPAHVFFKSPIANRQSPIANLKSKI